MQKETYNKIYNTETGEVIGVSCISNDIESSADWCEWFAKKSESDDIPVSLENSVKETLYKRVDGGFLLDSEFSGNGCDENCQRMLYAFATCMEKLSEEEAKSWVEERLGKDTYVELFGMTEE